MKRVITYGTFDILHYGHLLLLERARSLGDFLMVGVSTDNFNQLKNKKSLIKFEHRKLLVNALRCVDLTFPEETWDQKPNDIKNYKADIFVIGNDWKGKFDYLEEYCEVVYLERTPNISSSMLKGKM